MKSNYRCVFFLVFLLVPGVLSARQGDSRNDVIGADTIIHGVPRLISRQFSFTEGPAADREGNVYFTDQPNNKIWKYGTDGRLTVFMDTAGRANGMYFDKKGNLIACADEHDQLWAISPDKKVKILVEGFGGARLNGPNDVWVAPGGGIYFTDPYYQRDYWKRKSPDPRLKGQKVYYLAPHATAPVVVADNLKKPNGLVGTPDGKHLFVADIEGGKTYKYDITPDGTLTHARIFVNRGSDGMTIDNKGDIYLAGKGITIYSPAGVKTGYIPIPEPWASNVCFGGRHRDQLFITASTAIYIVQMKKVKGVQ